MKLSLLLALPILLSASLLLTSCETTSSGYGYVASDLDPANVQALFQLADEAINDGDFDLFATLHAPTFRLIDESDRPIGYGMQKGTYSYAEYMELARETFRQVSNLQTYTQVTDIRIEENQSTAKATVQEDLLTEIGGFEKRVITLAEVDVGFEEGWIFFEETRVLARQEIR